MPLKASKSRLCLDQANVGEQDAQDARRGRDDLVPYAVAGDDA